jgi:hypothetical protein
MTDLCGEIAGTSGQHVYRAGLILRQGITACGTTQTPSHGCWGGRVRV